MSHRGIPFIRSLVVVAVVGLLSAGLTAGTATTKAPATRPAAPPVEPKAVNVQVVKDLEGRGGYINLRGSWLFLTSGVNAKNQAAGFWFDIAKDPASPELISKALPGAWDIALHGDYALLCDYTPSLTIYDTRDKQWKEVARLKTPSMTENVVVRGHTAYVATHNAGLTVVDLAAPDKPAIIANMNPKIDCDAIGMAGDCVVLYAHWQSRLVFVDVKDPAQPREVGVYQHEGGFNQGELDIADGFAYCTGKTLVIVDMRDPAKPALLKSVDFGSPVSDVVVKDGFAFVAAGRNGVRVLDVRDPAKMAEVGVYQSADLHAAQLDVHHSASAGKASQQPAGTPAAGDVFHIYVANSRGAGRVLRFSVP